MPIMRITNFAHHLCPENEILKKFYKKYKASRPDEDDPSRQNSKKSVLVSGLKQIEMMGQTMKNIGSRRLLGQIEPEPAPMTTPPFPRPSPLTKSSNVTSFENIVDATKEEGVEDQDTAFSRLLEAAAKVHICKYLDAYLLRPLECLCCHLIA